MHNIDLKARLQDSDAAYHIAHELCDRGPDAVLHQIDTYLTVPKGRLKLREIVTRENNEHSAELIFYERADDAGPKKCDYEITPVANPVELKGTLSAALGIRTVVVKERTLFLYENVRIHLDRVEGLGSFLEFEAVMSDGVPSEQGEPLVAELMRRFGIEEGDIGEVPGFEETPSLQPELFCRPPRHLCDGLSPGQRPFLPNISPKYPRKGACESRVRSSLLVFYPIRADRGPGLFQEVDHIRLGHELPYADSGWGLGDDFPSCLFRRELPFCRQLSHRETDDLLPDLAVGSSGVGNQDRLGVPLRRDQDQGQKG